MDLYSMNSLGKLRKSLPDFSVSLMKFDNKYLMCARKNSKLISFTFSRFMQFPSVHIDTQSRSLINNELINGLSEFFSKRFNGLVFIDSQLLTRGYDLESLNEYVANYDSLFSLEMPKAFTNYSFDSDLASKHLVLSDEEFLSLKPSYINEMRKLDSCSVQFKNDENEYLDLIVTEFLGEACLCYISRSEQLRGKQTGRFVIERLTELMKSKSYSRLLIKEPYENKISFYESLGAVHDEMVYDSLKLYYIPLK